MCKRHLTVDEELQCFLFFLLGNKSESMSQLLKSSGQIICRSENKRRSCSGKCHINVVLVFHFYPNYVLVFHAFTSLKRIYYIPLPVAGCDPPLFKCAPLNFTKTLHFFPHFLILCCSLNSSICKRLKKC